MQQKSSTIYLPVWKLIVFSILSLGAYSVYWFYRTWKYLGDSNNENLSAGWRTFGMLVPMVNLFVSYNFFKRIDAISKLSLIQPFFLSIIFFGISSIFIFGSILLNIVLIPLTLGIAQSALNKNSSDMLKPWTFGMIVTCTLLVLFLSPVGSVATALGIRTFVASPFQVDGSAMASTFHHRETLIANKFVYLFRVPHRGEIVVYRPPFAQDHFYIHRIIGIPGDTVVIRGGYVFFRDKNTGKDVQLTEPYLQPSSIGKTYRAPVTGSDVTEEIFIVPEDQYFVLGDNRQGSMDSRGFAIKFAHASPFIPRDNIVGRL